MFMMIMFSKSVLSHDLNLLTEKIFDLDDSKILEVIEMSENGDEMASLLLGYIYYDGVVVEKNKDVSIQYLDRVMINESLLSWKYLIIAFWEVDKDEYDNVYVRKVLEKSVRLGNRSAELQLAIEIIIGDDENDKADLLLKKNLNNKENGKYFVEYAAAFYGYNKLKQKKTKELIDDLPKLRAILDRSWLPVKYLFYKLLIIIGLLPDEKQNLDVYDLLSRDVDVYNQNFEGVTLEIKNKSMRFLKQRAENNMAVDRIYNFSNKCIGTAYLKCLRVISLVLSECEVIEPLKNILTDYRESKYFHRCKDVRFNKYLKLLEEW